MKIVDVVFPAYINAPIGPTGTLRRLIANRSYLASRGYELNIFTLDSLTNIANYTEESHPIDFSKGLSLRSRIKDFCKKSRFLSTVLMYVFAYKENNFLNAYLRLDRNPDYVVFHSAMPCHYYMKRKKSQSKVILFHHSNGLAGDMFVKSYPKLKNSLYLKSFIRKYKYINSRVDQNVFISYEGFNNFKVDNPNVESRFMSVFHNGIENFPMLDVPKVTTKKYNLCTTGTVCERKGQYIIIDALSRLDSTKRSNIHLSIYGNGPDLANLKIKVKEYNLEETVSFFGYVPNVEIHKKLSENNIYLLMSNNEGLPISIIEAMRAGLGVISTSISGIPELVDDRNGILIQPSTLQLYEILYNLDQYDWEAIGQASRKRFDEEFTFQQMINSYCNMLDKVSYI